MILRFPWLLLALCAILLHFKSIDSLVRCPNRAVVSSQRAWELFAKEGKRKRRSNIIKPASPSKQDTSVIEFVGEGKSLAGLERIDFKALEKNSKLPPIKGTSREKQIEFDSKDPLQRIIDEYTAPTPAGQEPKSVQLVKTITWGAVLLLVIAEIVVSVKVGGMPFGNAPDTKDGVGITTSPQQGGGMMDKLPPYEQR